MMRWYCDQGVTPYGNAAFNPHSNSWKFLSLKNQLYYCTVVVTCLNCWLVAIFSGRSQQAVKPRPNDRNMSMQHIATLLGATCCVRLATLLRRVATCWVLLTIFKLELTTPAKLSQHCNTTYRNIVGRNMLRVFGHPSANYCDMLGVVGSTLTFFKLESTCRHPSQHCGQTYTTCWAQPLRYVVLKCCDRLAGAGWTRGSRKIHWLIIWIEHSTLFDWKHNFRDCAIIIRRVGQ